MHKIILVFFLVCAVFWSAHQANAAACQNKMVIVYGNGMFNDELDAGKSKTELQRKLVELSQTYADQTKYDFVLAYASDGRQFQLGSGNPNPVVKLMNAVLNYANTFIGQPTEVILQKVLQDDWSMFWRWLSGIQSVSPSIQIFMNQIAAGANASTYLFDPDLQNQVALYRGFLNAGKQIVIVSHSQGNFYANAAYSMLTLQNAAWASSVGVVQIATPAASNQGSKLGNNEPQITVPEDEIMKFIHNTSFGLVMPTKPITGWSPNLAELGTTAWADASFGHNFVQWYLTGTYTHNFIMNGIVTVMNSLQRPFKNELVMPRNIKWGYATFMSASACIMDDVNQLAFSVQTTIDGQVTVSAVSAVAGNSSTVPPLSGQIPALSPQEFRRLPIGIVAVPKGIGIVYADESLLATYWWDSEGNGKTTIGSTEVSLVTYQWEQLSGGWIERASFLLLPEYNMTVENPFGCAGTPCGNIPPLSGPGDLPAIPAIPAYINPIQIPNALYTYGGLNSFSTNQSKMVFGGYIDTSLSFTWLVVMIQNAQLAVSSSGVATIPLDTTGYNIVPTTIYVGVTGSMLLNSYRNDSWVSSGNFFGMVGVSTQ